jgi:acyl-CoA reductase-like NAD-dependent aldehyde dehydrogenase/uncharacterized protein (DUF2141 family)
MMQAEAVERLKAARLAQPRWGRISVRERCTVLAKLRAEIAGRVDEIVEAIRLDTDKPRLDALAGDVMVTLEQMRYYERNASRILSRRQLKKPAVLYSGTEFIEVPEPYGVVLIFAPFNYPFQLAVIPMISALVAGNSVILKCSEKTPVTARLIEELCRAAGLDAELVQVVDWETSRASELLNGRPDFLFFTGSSEAGKCLAKRAGELMIPAVFELGGKDAALVFADCDVDRAVEGVVYGAFANSGQVCVGIKRLYVEQSVYLELLGKMVKRIGQLRMSADGEGDIAQLPAGPIRDRLAAQIKDAMQKGARIEYPSDGEITGGTPVVLSEVGDDSRLMREETFGPVLCVGAFRDEEEAIELANGSPYQLSASVWTGNVARGERVAERLEAGTCAVNDVIRNIANPYSSFGGNAMSGYGRYHGPEGLRCFSRVKTVMVTRERGKRERHWFPFTRETYDGLKKFMGMRHGRGLVSHLLDRILPLLLCVAWGVILQAQAPATKGDLEIRVKIPAHSQGEIAYLVFASPDGFPNNKAKALKSGFVPLSNDGSEVKVDTGELAPGEYAVSVYQDVNGNKKLDGGFLGIPKEPVGASNDPRPRFGPPSFRQCAFQMGTANKIVEISLVNGHE